MKKYLFHIIFTLFCSALAAQEKNVPLIPDTNAIRVKEVMVVHYKTGHGIKTVQMDSLLMKVYQGKTLADLLQASGTVYIRQYAPGQLSSISMRGGNASQTQVMWNGFNLNNLSLGQTDFSLVPATLFTGVQVNLGAMGATGGNGVVAGSVELTGKENLGQGQTAIGGGLQAGSFGRFSANAVYAHRGEKYQVAIKPFYSTNKNQYPYLTTEGKQDTVEHAATDMKGAMVSYTCRFKKSVISADAWLQQSHRDIPATIVESRSYASQDDQSLRFTFNQLVDGTGFFKANRIGYFYDQLDYMNPLFDENSGFKVHNVIGETESFWKHRNSVHRIKIFVSGATAQNTGYETGNAQLFRTSLGYFFETALTPGGKLPLQISAALKEEVNNQTLSVPIAQLGLTSHKAVTRGGITYVFTTKLNLGTVYRFPTLNDLYWYPGGNPALKPEKGGSGNVSVALDLLPAHRNNGNFLRIDFSHYQRYMYDWIMWLPKGTVWSPQNLQEVWSRGNEASLSFQWGKKVKLFSRNVFNYTLSTIQKSHLPNDQSIHRQLIYTPMYNAVTEWGIRYKGFSLSGNFSYYGYRYTSSDNYEYLEPFCLLGARLLFTQKTKTGMLDVFADAANLLDETYYWVAQRPALPRNFNIGISFKWMSKQKAINTIQ